MIKKIIRKFLPQRVINDVYHLPVGAAANFSHGFPSKKLKVIGVTGTDGKTTTTNMIYRILKDAGKKVSMISTINAVIGGKEIDTGFHVTSPDPLMLQKLLKESANNGDEYFVLEVTSHGLDQHRFFGVNFYAGVITNITHEHLDYHKSWNNYFLAKAKLIKNVKFAILNKDEGHFARLSKLTGGEVLSFGLSEEADLNPEKFPFKLGIMGDFNVLNGLAAAATTLKLGIDKDLIKKSLENLKSLNGRMEEVENKKGLKIIVDFAHTPNALEKALKTLRKSTSGNLISVFGCAGLRDVEKRELMGEVSAKLADKTVITSEDPRGLIDQINKMILKGIEKGGGEIGKDVFVINDRQKAISFAINNLAKKGDLVGIFGKGHENSLNMDGKVEIPWSDKEAVLEAVGDG